MWYWQYGGSLAFVIPSGAITEDAQARYNEAVDGEEDIWDEDAALPKPAAVLANAVFSDILPSANVEALPADLFAPGARPRAITLP